MIPNLGQLAILAAAGDPPKVTHARFLALIVGIVVVFLGALALLTIMRILRRRASARFDRGNAARAGRGSPGQSPWHAAGQRAQPEPIPASSKPPRDADDEDDEDDDTGDFPALDDDDDDGGPDPDDSGEFGDGPPKRFG